MTTYGSARWATLKEIKAAGLFAAKGVFLGRFENNTFATMDRNTSCALRRRGRARRRTRAADIVVLDFVRGGARHQG